MKALSLFTTSKSFCGHFVLVVISLCFNYFLGTHTGVMKTCVHLKNNVEIKTLVCFWS